MAAPATKASLAVPSGAPTPALELRIFASEARRGLEGDASRRDAKAREGWETPAGATRVQGRAGSAREGCGRQTVGAKP